MDDQTPNLSLPFIMPSQAQKHITHNEAIRRLDALTQMAAESRVLTQPPAAPANGMAYLIPEGATGEWIGHDNEIAAFQDGTFIFLTPKAGWRVYVRNEGLFVYDNDSWSLVSGGSSDVSNLTELGVNSSADETNRLSVRSDAVLLSHETGDIRTVINKETTSDTAALLFQTDFSGRAEVGLTGDDDFHFRVSADGNQFADSLVLDHQTGRVNFPNGFSRNGVTVETLMAANAQTATLSGPNALRFDPATQRLGWLGRFISIATGAGNHFSATGYFNIDQPASGSAIVGADGTLADTATNAGIHLGAWEALYYVLPIGLGFASQSGNFRKINYTSPFSFPTDEVWVFIALHNGDTGEIRVGNGETLYQGSDFQPRTHDQRAPSTFPAFHAYNVTNFNGNQSLVFRSIQTNNGNHYDPTTGVFTAPRRGLYSFDCHIFANNTNPAGSIFSISFRRNSAFLVSGRGTFIQLPIANLYTPLRATTLIELEVGDTIDCFLGGGQIWHGTDLNHFTGHLISTGE